MKWINVNDKELPADKEFIAAVPYNDSMKPNENNLWWIKHCVVDEEIGLCVVGDVDNEPAGWGVEDITHFIELPEPPKTVAE